MGNNKRLEDEVIRYEINDIIENSIKLNDICIVKKIYDNKNIKYILKIASKLSDYNNIVALLGIKNEDKVNLIFACSKNLEYINISNILKDVITLVDGKGGGNNFLAQGGGKNNGNLESSIDYALSIIEKICK